MKMWSRYSWRSDETKLISAILDAAKESEASKVASEGASRDGVAPERSATTLKVGRTARTNAG